MIWIEKVFLQALGAACEKTGWQLHAYVIPLPKCRMIRHNLVRCFAPSRSSLQS